MKLRRPDGLTTDYLYGSYGINSWLAVPDESGSIVVGGLPRAFAQASGGLLMSPVQAASRCSCIASGGAPGSRTLTSLPLTRASRVCCLWMQELDTTFLHKSAPGDPSMLRFWTILSRKIGLKEAMDAQITGPPVSNTANAWTKAGGVQPERRPQWMRHLKDY